MPHVPWTALSRPKPSAELKRAQELLNAITTRIDEVVLWVLPSAPPYLVVVLRLLLLYGILRAGVLFCSVSRFKTLRAYDKTGGRFVPGRHSWVQTKDSVLLRGLDPRYCSICRGVAHGFSDGAVQCSICSCRAHSTCLGRGGLTALPCKAVHRGQLLLAAAAAAHASTTVPSGPITTSKTPHQWVRCSVPAGRACACCGDLFRGERLGLHGHRCTWCAARVHDRCLRRAQHSFCTLGRHRKLMLPPAAVVEQPRRHTPSQHGGRIKAALRSVIPGADSPPDAPQNTTEPPTNNGTAAGAGTDPAAAASATAWVARVEDVSLRRTLRVRPGGGLPRARARARDATLDIDPDAVPRDIAPLAVLVNTRSGAGARQGRDLLTALRGHLNPLQVADIGSEDPADFLRRFARVRRLRVLCCGGDGTVAWVLRAIDQVAWQRGPPPLAVLPMGTGNDLARVLGWGGGYDGTEDLGHLLDTVAASREVMVDRWSVDVVPLKAKGKDKGVRSVPMGNYMGIGVDGQVALEFHRMREAHSGLFFSRVVNKLVYACTGLRNVLFPSCQNLRAHVELHCDGAAVPLPELTESVIVLNINSYAGGSRLWTPEGPKGASGMAAGDRLWGFGVAGPAGPARAPPQRLLFADGQVAGGSSGSGGSDVSVERPGEGTPSEVASPVGGGGVRGGGAAFGPSRMDDGLLEVVAVTGVLHLGRIQVGIGAGHAVAQGRELRLRTLRALPMQVDGEPWRQPPSEIIVQRHPQALMLRPATPEENRSRDMLNFHEQVVAAARRKGHVSKEQGRQLAAEAQMLAAAAHARRDKFFID